MTIEEIRTALHAAERSYEWIPNQATYALIKNLEAQLEAAERQSEDSNKPSLTREAQESQP